LRKWEPIFHTEITIEILQEFGHCAVFIDCVAS
jgi:hypothetical protein